MGPNCRIKGAANNHYATCRNGRPVRKVLFPYLHLSRNCDMTAIFFIHFEGQVEISPTAPILPKPNGGSANVHQHDRKMPCRIEQRHCLTSRQRPTCLVYANSTR